MNRSGWILVLCLNAFLVEAQQDSLSPELTTAVYRKKTEISFYADVYYVFDFSNPKSHERPGFLYNHNRHNEVNLNLGYVKAAHASGYLRANLALMAGTYAQYNLASEPDVLQHVFEANAGIKLSTKHNLWLDAGILPSHIGFESAVSKDCRTLTRSIVAENSPYYMAGAVASYKTKNEKWFASLLILNGWQRIQRVKGNNTPNAGTQLSYRPDKKLFINYSTFIGNDKPDSARQMRYYSNLYVLWQAFNRAGFIFGTDLGLEQESKNSNRYHHWFAPAAIIHCSLAKKTGVAARVEYFRDVKGVIIKYNGKPGFEMFGYSVNVDYKPGENVVLRLEGRLFSSPHKIFPSENASILVKENFSLAASVAFSL